MAFVLGRTAVEFILYLAVERPVIRPACGLGFGRRQVAGFTDVAPGRRRGIAVDVLRIALLDVHPFLAGCGSDVESICVVRVRTRADVDVSAADLPRLPIGLREIVRAPRADLSLQIEYQLLHDETIRAGACVVDAPLGRPRVAAAAFVGGGGGRAMTQGYRGRRRGGLATA